MRDQYPGPIPPIEDWISKNKSQLEKYNGLNELLTIALLFAKKDYAKALEVSSEITRAEIKLGTMELKARSYEELGNYDLSIKERSEMLSIEELLPESDSPDRIRNAILKSILKKGDIDQLLSREASPFHISQEKIGSIIRNLFKPERLEEICQSNSVEPIFQQEACSALARIYLYDNQTSKAFIAISKLGKDSKDKFNELKPFALSKIGLENNPKLLNATAKFFIEDGIDIAGSDYDNVTSYFKDLANFPNYRIPKLTPYKSPFKIFEEAQELAKNSKNKEAEAEAISSIINCFQPNHFGFFCRKGEDTEEKYPKERRKSLFNSLKINFKNTKWGKKQAYWY